jgi:hypothetical protein
VDGSPWASGWLNTLDPARALKTAGGHCAWTRNRALPAGTKTVKVEIDTGNDVAELSESNNWSQKSYTCQPDLPDLIVNRIQILDGCKLKITLKNIGTAGVPNSAYGSSANSVQFRVTVAGNPWISGWLDTLDATKALKTPGAYASWTRNKALPSGTNNVKVEIDTSNKLAELSESNNWSQKSYTCQPDLPDLIVNRLQILDGCKLKITIKNIGTAGVPNSAYGNSSTSVMFRVHTDDRSWISGWLDTLDRTKALKTPGSHCTWTWNRALPRGTRVIKVTIDNGNRLMESNETNNMMRKNVNCN